MVFFPFNSSETFSIRAYSFITRFGVSPWRSAISQSIIECAGVMPTAPVPYDGSISLSAIILIVNFAPAKITSYDFPT